jgi:hypothetical protein
MTNDEIADAISILRQRAGRRFASDALWHLIFDAEALLKGERTLASRHQIEFEIERALQSGT